MDDKNFNIKSLITFLLWRPTDSLVHLFPKRSFSFLIPNHVHLIRVIPFTGNTPAKFIPLHYSLSTKDRAVQIQQWQCLETRVNDWHTTAPCPNNYALLRVFAFISIRFPFNQSFQWTTACSAVSFLLQIACQTHVRLVGGRATFITKAKLRSDLRLCPMHLHLFDCFDSSGSYVFLPCFVVSWLSPTTRLQL